MRSNRFSASPAGVRAVYVDPRGRQTALQLGTPRLAERAIYQDDRSMGIAAEGQIDGMKSLFQRRLTERPHLGCAQSVRLPVTTQRTIGGPGWPQGSSRGARAAVGNPTGRWSVARHRRADTPRA